MWRLPHPPPAPLRRLPPPQSLRLAAPLRRRQSSSAPGCGKLYLSVFDAPPSERPFAFVLQLAREMDSTLVWVFVAFGHGHPRAGVRSVYDRAHPQLHGRFPERG